MKEPIPHPENCTSIQTPSINEHHPKFIEAKTKLERKPLPYAHFELWSIHAWIEFLNNALKNHESFPLYFSLSHPSSFSFSSYPNSLFKIRYNSWFKRLSSLRYPTRTSLIEYMILLDELMDPWTHYVANRRFLLTYCKTSPWFFKIDLHLSKNIQVLYICEKRIK